MPRCLYGAMTLMTFMAIPPPGQKETPCRTAALGGHVARCEDCAHIEIAYNSCRNRHCPKCQGAAAREWLAEREAELLPLPYYHLVFTLAVPIADIAYQNTAAIYDLLFKAAAETVLTIAVDPKHLGARVGITAVLHTWGSALTHHPHVHMIVPGGDISPDDTRWDRSTGLGLSLLTWIALLSDSYAEALKYSEQSLAVAVVPWDRQNSINGKGCASVLLRQTAEGEKLLEEFRRRCVADGYLYPVRAADCIIGVCKVLEGDIRGGIRLLEEVILTREKEGYRSAADWSRFILCEVYLQIIAGNDKPPFKTVLRNLPILLKVMISASSRICALATHCLENPHFDPAGHHVGHAQMILGLLYKATKKRALVFQHLTEARRILCQFGQTPMLARLDVALAELEQ